MADLGASVAFNDRSVRLEATNELSVRVDGPPDSTMTILMTSEIWDISR